MGRIIGESFREYVDKQIDVRQKQLGKFKRDNNIHAYLTGKTGWLRLSSSVDTITSDKRKELQNKGGVPSTYGEKDLARNYVLFGGVQRVGGFYPKGGLINDYDDNWSNEKAYGFNSTKDFGLTPMPFIESAEIAPKNRGSLRLAEIKIKCFNPQQFFVIETLYLRLKYSLLLEWGHTMYFDNNNSLVTSPTTNQPYQKFLNASYATSGPSRQDQCLADIENARESSNGNYDGFLGWVQNFRWSVTPDGHYDIVIKAVSYGDVIESLTVNKALDTKPDEDIPDDIRPAYATTLGKILLTLKDRVQEGYSGSGSGVSGVGTSKLYRENGTFLTASEIKRISKLKTDIFTKPSGVPLVNNELIGCTYDSRNPDGNNTFIKLGTLLRIIESFLLEYDTSMNTRNPIFELDYDYNDNYCLITPGIFSNNPRVCIFPSEFIYPSNLFPTDANPVTVPSVTSGAFGLGAASITYSNSSKFRMKQDPSNLIKTCGDDFLLGRGDGASVIGRHLHIHVNIDFILNLLDSSINDSNELPLFDLLKTICDKINQSFSDTINLEPFYDSDTNILHIIDTNNNNLLQKYLGQTIPSPTKINVGLLKPGEGSFVTDTTIESELSNKFATQIAIGAQANNTNLGSNSTTFSKWNAGLEDRLIKQKNNNNIPPPSGNKEDATKKVQSTLICANLMKNMAFDNALLGAGGTSFGTYANFEDYSTELSTFWKERSDRFYKKYNFRQGFIPINLGLTLDGISGPRLFEKYTITEDFLPQNYQDNIEFIIKGLKHTINKEGWFTKIEGLSIPKET